MTSAGQFGPYPFIDSRGNALPAVEILIYDSTGTTLASLYSDRARTPLANPLPTGVADGVAGVDTAGNAIFWADADEYLMVVRYGGTQRYQAPITISADPDDANAVLSVNGRSGIVIGLAENADLVAEAATARANEGANAAAIATEASTRATQDGLLIPLTQRAAANGVATLDAGSKVPTAQLPALAITETFPVASQAAMLALTAQRGDVAIRTDLNKSFILSTDSPSTLADWKELLTPTDSVTSVNARVGVVSGLAEADASNVAASAAAWRSAIGAQAAGTSVLLTGDQSVDGVKAFADPPTVPDPVGVTDAVNRRTAIASISAAGGLPGTLDEARDSLRMMDLFRHDDDPQYSVWRQDTGGQQAWWLSRFIGDGRYDAYEIRTVVVGGAGWAAGNTAAQLRRHQIRRPLLSLAFADGAVTFTPAHASGIWTEITDAATPGGQYRYDATAGRYVEWTTPADVEVVGVNTFVTTNGGYGVVKIDGDATRATLCPTAQDEVDAGRLSSTALVANGGTLNPTDRLWNNYGPSNKDFYAVFADDLTAGVHVVRITVTGYAPTGSTDARIYVADFTYWKAGVTFASANVTRATLAFLFNQSTVFEYALEVLPDGASTAPFLGNSHGGDQQLAAPTITVDGSPVTLANLEGVDGDDISITRTSELRHPDLGSTVIANITVTWTITTKGLVVDYDIEWLVDGTTSDGGSYTAMMGGDKSLTRGRTTGGVAADLNANDASFKSGSRASAAAMWEGGSEGHYAVLAYVPDVGASLTDWQYLDLENGFVGVAPVAIQDRSDLINKIYFNRGDEPFRAGDVWSCQFVMSAAYFDDPEATLASPVPLDDAVAALTAEVAEKQPLDSDLTAIAALTTTSYGRALLALADAAAGRTAFGLGTASTHAHGDYDTAGAAAAAQAASQPLDSDLTAIAALTSTAFGRSLLTLADAAALLTAAGSPADGGLQRQLQGAIGVSFDRTSGVVASAGIAALTSGIVTMILVSVPRAGTASHVQFLPGTTAAVGPTHSWVVLCDMTGKVLAVSADKTSGAISASSLQTYDFVAPVPVTPGTYYVGLCVTAGTVPTILGLGQTAAINKRDPVIVGAGSTLATPPAVNDMLTLPTSATVSAGPAYVAVT